MSIINAPATAANADRATAIHPNDDRSFLAIFGRIEGTDFIVAHSQSSRTYKTLKGAQRAATKWNNA